MPPPPPDPSSPCWLRLLAWRDGTDPVYERQESGSDVHQHKQALKDLEAKLVVSARQQTSVLPNGVSREKRKENAASFFC